MPALRESLKAVHERTLVEFTPTKMTQLTFAVVAGESLAGASLSARFITLGVGVLAIGAAGARNSEQ